MEIYHDDKYPWKYPMTLIDWLFDWLFDWLIEFSIVVDSERIYLPPTPEVEISLEENLGQLKMSLKTKFLTEH